MHRDRSHSRGGDTNPLGNSLGRGLCLILTYLENTAQREIEAIREKPRGERSNRASRNRTAHGLTRVRKEVHEILIIALTLLNLLQALPTVEGYPVTIQWPKSSHQSISQTLNGQCQNGTCSREQPQFEKLLDIAEHNEWYKWAHFTLDQSDQTECVLCTPSPFCKLIIVPNPFDYRHCASYYSKHCEIERQAVPFCPAECLAMASCPDMQHYVAQIEDGERSALI